MGDEPMPPVEEPKQPVMEEPKKPAIDEKSAKDKKNKKKGGFDIEASPVASSTPEESSVKDQKKKKKKFDVDDDVKMSPPDSEELDSPEPAPKMASGFAGLMSESENEAPPVE